MYRELVKLNNKEDRKQLAKYKLASLSKRNPKATASIELVNEVLKEIRNPENNKERR